MSGSDCHEIQEAGHGRDAVEHAFIHAHIDDLRAVLHLLLGHGQRLVVLTGQDQLLELGGAGHVGALADVDEIGLRRLGERLHAAQPQKRFDPRNRRGGRSRTASAMAWMCSGVVPQQPPTMFSQPFSAQSRICGARDLRRFRKAGRRQRIRQSCVGIDADVGVRQMRQFLHVGPHQVRTEGAIEAHAQGAACVTEFQNASTVCPLSVRPARSVMVPEIMMGGRSAGSVKREANDLLDGEQRRLGVQGVKDGFQQQQIHPAVHQHLHLLAVGLTQLPEV